MKKLRSTLLLIVCSVAGLILLLNWRDVWGLIDQDALDIEIASAEEIDRLSQGKEEHAIEPEILLNGSTIAYDVSQNMLLIPQDPSKSYFDGKLSVPEGRLFFLEDEEGFSDKAASMAENRVFRLFWVRETDVWMYNVYFTSMPVMCLSQTSVDDVDENGGATAWDGTVWLYDPYRENAQFQQSTCDYHIRGNTTRGYPKSSYKLNLEQKQSLLGMQKDDDWILSALYDDEGLIHNRLSYLVWHEIAASNDVDNDEGISMEYVELFVDGSYRGVYGLSGQINRKTLHLNKGDILYKYRDLSFAEEGDYYAPGEEPENRRVSIEYPKDFDMSDWEPLREWMDLFKEDPVADYDRAVELQNMENAIDYNIFIQLLFGMDNILKNIYFVADYQTDGTYRIMKIPWDLNMTWGNSWTDEYDCHFNRFKAEKMTMEGGFTEDMSDLYEANPAEISELLLTRWQELRREIITPEHISEMLSQELSYLYGSGAYTRNELFWPPTCDHWNEAQLYEYIDTRIAFLDTYYEKLYTDSH